MKLQLGWSTMLEWIKMPKMEYFSKFVFYMEVQYWERGFKMDAHIGQIWDRGSANQKEAPNLKTLLNMNASIMYWKDERIKITVLSIPTTDSVSHRFVKLIVWNQGCEWRSSVIPPWVIPTPTIWKRKETIIYGLSNDPGGRRLTNFGWGPFRDMKTATVVVIAKSIQRNWTSPRFVPNV